MAELHLPHRERTRHVHLTGMVYATPTGFKLGTRGAVVPPSVFYGSVSKSNARRVRKAARKAGFHAHASAPREFVPF